MGRRTAAKGEPALGPLSDQMRPWFSLSNRKSGFQLSVESEYATDILRSSSVFLDRMHWGIAWPAVIEDKVAQSDILVGPTFGMQVDEENVSATTLSQKARPGCYGNYRS